MDSMPSLCYSMSIFTPKRITSQILGWTAIVLFICVLIAANVVLFIACKKYINRVISNQIDSTDLNGRISGVVNNYLALRDQNEGKSQV